MAETDAIDMLASPVLTANDRASGKLHEMLVPMTVLIPREEREACGSSVGTRREDAEA